MPLLKNELKNKESDRKFIEMMDNLKGIPGDDGYTPVKGEDYFDGKDGKDGLNGKNGKDGKSIQGKDGKNGKDGFDGLNGSPDTAEDIAKKLNTTENSLDISVIKGLHERLLPRNIEPYNGKTISSKRIKMFINGEEQNEALGSLNLVGTASHTGQDYTFSGGAGSSPLTTKGDIYTYDTTNARLPVGTDGQVLIADSAESTGVKWGSATATGSLVFQTVSPLLLSAGVTRYISCGGASLFSSESRTQVPQIASGSYTLIKVNVISNTLSGTCTIALRRNGITTAPSISIPSGTGVFTSTGTQAVVIDDLVNLEIITASGTGSVEIGVIISKVV